MLGISVDARTWPLDASRSSGRNDNNLVYRNLKHGQRRRIHYPLLCVLPAMQNLLLQIDASIPV